MSKHVTVHAVTLEFSDKALLAIGHSLGRVSAVSPHMATKWAIDQIERAVAQLQPDITDD